MLDRKALGLVIKNRRRERNIKQSQVSSATKLSRNYISDIENGRYVPSVETLTKIAVYLDLDLNVLKMSEIQVDMEA
ncbi:MULTISPECIES: helix-turn-helix domain-containing protein [unclassified Brevibacillus]|jgi:transcriptional regulator with XRE-family HTH domain|uniref:helix-turn-helix domain-containing protein n=1 Tax=unclassified Brevibacillus TaxID=2684853 RepID=UPI0014908F27|nr:MULTISPECIES: helix-turn-helix transcriptional regulator [unclassified Brevibacillus]MBR8659574.1 helix-turn-helix transcriptional regulator [Brevibacillus sp. NL20B1]NNV01931.1 XRE family transcriptional regulator [Brevibacillus sp. MCWH]